MKAKAKETSARIGLAALAGAGMTFAFPALAFAAEEESSGGLSAILPDLEDAKAQAAQIVADAKKTGEAVKADITDKAQSEATAMIEKAHNAIEAEKKAAISELQGSVADLSVSVASRLIGEDLNDAEHRKIIERYVNEAGSFNAN